jgi:MFS family permease
MSVGIGVGMLVMAPLVGGYLIPTLGWRASYLVLAIIMLTPLPLAIFLIKTKPAGAAADYGDLDNSDVSTKTGVPGPAPNGLNLKAALGTTAFWLIAFSFFANGFGVIGTAQNQALHIQDIGYSLEIAAYTITAMGIGSAVGKFLFGWLCDVIPVRYVCAISFLLLAIATIILLSMRPGTPVTILWLYGVILGLGGGGWLPTMSIFISTNFGLKSYGAIFGTIILIQNMDTAFGPLFAGSLFDATNTYQGAFITFLSLYALTIPALLLIRRPRALARA